MASTFEVPRHAMAVYAHPDDVDFGASGTLAAWADRGARITYCVLTSGQKGTHDPDMPPDKLARIREREQRAAGKVVGATEFVYLGHQDGELEVTMSLRAEVCKAIRVHKPDAILTQDPWRHYQTHPDHRVAGWVAMDGLIAARDHLFFTEQLRGGLTHHRVKRVFLFGTSEPNMWFDIGGTMERKLGALKAHESQVKDFASLSERMRGWAESIGETWGIGAAEAFRYMELG